MRRILCLFCAALLLSFCCAAQAAVSYPANQGRVTDLANVLGEDTVRDLTELSSRMKEAMDGDMYIVTRHFLGGADTAAYADGLFKAWGLGEMDALLLMVIGEEDYALSLGGGIRALLPDETRIALLGAQLRPAFLNREYDAAAAAFSLAYAGRLEKLFDTEIQTSGLLGQQALKSTPAPLSISQLWMNVFGDAWEGEAPDAPFAQEEEGISLRTLIIWGLVIYFLFFRKKKRNEARYASASRNRRRW